jgi:endonuclease/exonuclease/phosphatase family metal-dependent hydrolase
MELKILDINLWLLPPPLSAENQKRLSRFVELSKKLSPDIIALQEVWLIKYAKYLKANLPGYHAYFSKSKKFNKSGLVTLSKIKPASWSHEYFKASKKEGLVERAARKGYIIIKLKIDGKHLNVLNTHLHASNLRMVSKITISQFNNLRSATRRGNWIVVGDLNIPQQIFLDLNRMHFRYKSVRYPTLERSNRYARMRLNRFAKYPKKLDYVLLRTSTKKEFSVKTKRIRSPPLSDHYGLLSHIRLNGMKPKG